MANEIGQKTKKAGKAAPLAPVLRVEGRGCSAVTLGDRVVWGTTDGVHAFSLAEGNRLWDGPSELITANEASTSAADATAVVLRIVGQSPVRASVYRASDGSLVREHEVDALGVFRVARAFGGSCVIRDSFNEGLSKWFLVREDQVRVVDVDGEGFAPQPELAGTPTRLILGVMRMDVSAGTIERGTRAYDVDGRLVWRSSLRMIESRGAEHGVLAWDEARGLVMLDPDTGAERWCSSVAGLGKADAAAAVTRDCVAVAFYGEGGKQAIALLDAASGAVRWETAVKGKRFFARLPLVHRDRVLFLDGVGALAVCDAATGALLATAAEREAHAIEGSADYPFVAVLQWNPKENAVNLYRVGG